MSVHITLMSTEEVAKGDFVFPAAVLEPTATKVEKAVFTDNQAKFYVSPMNGFVKANEEKDSCRLVLRPLARDDFDKGYLDLLKQLTEIGEISPERFDERFSIMQKSAKLPALYYVCVLEDYETNRVIGSATLQLEYKFIRNCGIRGRIEDVVVDKNYRGKYLAKILLGFLVQLAKDVDCYKLSLECKDPLVSFYEKFGFIKEPLQNYMSQRFKE